MRADIPLTAASLAIHVPMLAVMTGVSCDLDTGELMWQFPSPRVLACETLYDAGRPHAVELNVRFGDLALATWGNGDLGHVVAGLASVVNLRAEGGPAQVLLRFAEGLLPDLELPPATIIEIMASPVAPEYCLVITEPPAGYQLVPSDPLNHFMRAS